MKNPPSIWNPQFMANDNGNCNRDELWRMKIKKFPHAYTAERYETYEDLHRYIHTYEIDMVLAVLLAVAVFFFTLFAFLRAFEAVNFNYYPFYFAFLLLSSLFCSHSCRFVVGYCCTFFSLSLVSFWNSKFTRRDVCFAHSHLKFRAMRIWICLDI